MFGYSTPLKKSIPPIALTDAAVTIELPYSGSQISNDQTLKLATLLERIKYHTELTEIDASKSYWSFFTTYYPVSSDITAKISIPIRDIAQKSDEYEQLKLLIKEREPTWMDTLDKLERKLITETSLALCETKDQKHIPIQSISITETGLLIAFVYTGRGMDDLRTNELDMFLKKTGYKNEIYSLFDGGKGVQMIIPLSEIINQKDNYHYFKEFIKIWCSLALQDLRIYEKQILLNNCYSLQKISI